MKWTKDKPTAEGYYWLKEYHIYSGVEKLGSPQIVSVDRGWSRPEELEVIGIGDECGMGKVSAFDKRSLWYGPIKPPEGWENDTK